MTQHNFLLCLQMAAIAQAGFGKTYGLTVTAAGSEINGQSSSTLTTGTVSATANQWRLYKKC